MMRVVCVSELRAKAQLVAGLSGADSPLAELRFYLLQFIYATGAFGVLHDKRTGAALGEHLMNCFDLLAERRCGAAVCAAGALHSIYGTNVFARTTVRPTVEQRSALAHRFGWRSEHLAFCFHACSRPHDLESGHLTSRVGPFAWSARDVHDLRLIEAANLTEQGYRLDRFPAIKAAWNLATEYAAAARSCELRPASRTALAWRLAKTFEHFGYAPRRVLRLACGEHTLDVSLPIRAADQRVALWLRACAAGHSDGSAILDVAVAVKSDGAAPTAIAFVFAGEGRFGMPASPLEALNCMRHSECSYYAFETVLSDAGARLHIEPAARQRVRSEVVSAAPSSTGLCHAMGQLIASVSSGGGPRSALAAAPQPVPISHLASGTASAAACEAAGRALFAQLAQRGWATVRVGREAAQAVAHAHEAIRALDATGGLARRACFDGGRAVGCGWDAGRAWINCRAGIDDDARFEWPAAARPQRDAIARAFAACEVLARAAFAALLSATAAHPSMVARHLLADQLTALTPMAAPGAGMAADPSERRLGPSVQRFLVYRDRPNDAPPGSAASSLHADMGLITLAPPSTIAALELLDPVDGQLHDPEAELGDETEWLLFAGETLAFLTGGQLHAPLHRVPWVERGSRPARCATPFFLRAAPWAVLTDPTGSIEITCRQLMERHCAARRPWRLQRAGSLNTGDW